MKKFFLYTVIKNTDFLNHLNDYPKNNKIFVNNVLLELPINHFFIYPNCIGLFLKNFKKESTNLQNS